MICPICGSDGAHTNTVDGQVCYQSGPGRPCYVVMSLDAYLQNMRKAALVDKLQKRILVDRQAEYVTDAEIGLDS